MRAPSILARPCQWGGDDVVSHADDAEMGGIDATPVKASVATVAPDIAVVAFVVYRHALRDEAVSDSGSKPVSGPSLPVNVNVAVAPVAAIAGKPAAVGRDGDEFPKFLG